MIIELEYTKWIERNHTRLVEIYTEENPDAKVLDDAMPDLDTEDFNRWCLVKYAQERII